jgi:hypothetical protein
VIVVYLDLAGEDLLQKRINIAIPIRPVCIDKIKPNGNEDSESQGETEPKTHLALRSENNRRVGGRRSSSHEMICLRLELWNRRKALAGFPINLPTFEVPYWGADESIYWMQNHRKLARRVNHDASSSSQVCPFPSPVADLPATIRRGRLAGLNG